MMVRQRRDQGRPFYEFRLENRIPENHLLRPHERVRRRAPVLQWPDNHRDVDRPGHGG